MWSKGYIKYFFGSTKKSNGTTYNFYLWAMETPKKFKLNEKFLAIGLVAGVLVGVITKNIGVWLPVGIAIGVGLGFLQDENSK